MRKLLILFILLILSGCQSVNENKVVIYSSMEDYRNEYFMMALTKQFPEYDIILEYLPTGEHAARLFSEGNQTLADISLDMEYSYMDKIGDEYEVLDDYDTNIFTEDSLQSDKKLIPLVKNAGCIVINREILDKKGLPVPTTYNDLLDPKYQNLIAMPSPKSSGTGYMFLKAMVNELGVNGAKEYFSALSDNILQFTSSGSGPVNMVLQGEIAIGLAMTGQVVTKINEGANLEISYLDGSSPYSMYGAGIIKGKGQRQAVRDVFDYIYEVLIPANNRLFFPEQIYKDIVVKVDNYPTNIKYADMANNGAQDKENLLLLWEDIAN